MNSTVKTILKWLILTALIALAVGISVWASAEARAGKCTGIDIQVIGQSGVDSVVRKGILTDLLILDPNLLKTPVHQIDTRKIELYLKRFSNFEKVECVTTSKNRLRIVVEPIVPELRVFDGNDSYYVNASGKRIPATAEFRRDVPIVAGHFSDEFPPERLLPVARYIARDTLLKHLFPMLYARDEHNILAVPSIKGHIVNLGDTTRLPQKFDKLMTMYRQVMPIRGWETYDTISVKYRGRIIATRRNKAPIAHATEYGDEPDPEEIALLELLADHPDQAQPQSPTSTTPTEE